MVADNLLIAGALFILSLAIGQMLVKRRQTSNKALTCLFAITFLWVTNAIGYRYGLLDRMPHLNKVYLPLLCITGSLWYTYVRCLHDENLTYIETQLSDWPSIFMYTATRLAELTILWFFIKTALFLHQLPERKKTNRHIDVSRILYYLSITAAIAATTRIAGSVTDNQTVSVLYPYRDPVVLSLSHSSRTIKVKPEGNADLESIRQKLQTHEWYLDPNLKVQSLARHIGIPATELSALVNTVTGMNFNEFINQYRIEYAKNLLNAETKKPILDVAYESGYNSKSAFYKHFTSVTSMTPAQYRKNRNAQPESALV